jgi:hypothetical protein
MNKFNKRKSDVLEKEDSAKRVKGSQMTKEERTIINNAKNNNNNIDINQLLIPEEELFKREVLDLMQEGTDSKECNRCKINKTGHDTLCNKCYKRIGVIELDNHLLQKWNVEENRQKLYHRFMTNIKQSDIGEDMSERMDHEGHQSLIYCIVKSLNDFNVAPINLI